LSLSTGGLSYEKALKRAFKEHADFLSKGNALQRAMVGDIGGTHARFAMVDLAAKRLDIDAPETLLCSEYESMDAAVHHYIDRLGADARPNSVAIAVAGPVVDGAMSFTNMNWAVSEVGLRRTGFGRALLINDYEALASATPLITTEHCHGVGPDLAQDMSKTVAILGAGTGFGVAALVRGTGGEAIMATEGGHIAFAPTDAYEIEILKRLMARFGRVSIERILSGPGLLSLYMAMCEIDGHPPSCDAPAQVTTEAQAGDGPAICAVARFCAILGSTAGDFALSYGAQGGVYIAGGVAPRLLSFFDSSDFRQRFEAKGRFESYLRAIPTGVVTHPYLALLGAARRLQSHGW
jgi:glucokinase